MNLFRNASNLYIILDFEKWANMAELHHQGIADGNRRRCCGSVSFFHVSLLFVWGARRDLCTAQRSPGSSYPLQTLLKLQLWTQLLGELLSLSFLLGQSLKIIPGAGKSQIDEEHSGFKAG